MQHPGLIPDRAEAELAQGLLVDIRAEVDGKPRHLWGRKGPEREKTMASQAPQNVLPVLLGAGLGVAIEHFRDSGRPVAVLDLETPLLEAATIHERFANEPLVFFAKGNSAPELLASLYDWQASQGGTALHPLPCPFYLRLRDGLYKTITDTLKKAPRKQPSATALYPKFQSAKPRVLFLNADYFLCREIVTALTRLEIPCLSIATAQSGPAEQGYIERILEGIVSFRPDFVLSINHLGLDRQGKITELLDRLHLPLASWFVDSPQLILYRYANLCSDKVVLFSYDEDTLAPMRALGFNNIHWLPLGTDCERFTPDIPKRQKWMTDVSFVGNSMLPSVKRFHHAARVPELLLRDWETMAGEFGDTPHADVKDFLRERYPKIWSGLKNVTDMEARQAYESLLTFEATRQYRLRCVQATLAHNPLIAGDRGWEKLLGKTGWRQIPCLDYYEELPSFYASATVNLNCTSLQMKGAVNQRVFDIPACGGFVLTDARRQMNKLFDPETETVAYHTPEDIPELLDTVLRDPRKRLTIAVNARKRILAHHTYEHRLQRLLTIMRKTFA